MRNSLPKTPPSGPSSMPSRPPRCWPSARTGPRLSARGPGRTPACRASASRSRQGPATTASCSRRGCGCSKGSSGATELADCAHLRAAVARRGARHHAVDLPGTAGRRDVAVRRSAPTGWPGPRCRASRCRSRTGATRWSPRSPTARSSSFRAPHSAADRKRRPATPFEDCAVPRPAARRLRLRRGRVRPAAGRRQRGAPARAALVHQRLQPEARSDPAPADAGRGRSQAGARALAALQHHQRRHRPDSADRHRRPAADRQRARADAVHRVGGRERRPPRRGAHEQHAAVVGAVEQGDRGDRRDPARAAARQSGRRIGPAVRAAQHRHRGRAAGHAASSRFCATSPTCAAPARRSRRTTARCASPRCRRAPRAIVST